MKYLLTIIIFISINAIGIAQETDKSSSEKLLSELAENGCKCVDSIDTYNKSKAEVAKDISICIDKQTGAYQMGSKLMNIADSIKNTNEKKNINIAINYNKNSNEYKKYYYELERYMMKNCTSLKEKIASEEKQSEKSSTDNKKALDFYSKGLAYAKKGNYKKAIKYYEKTVKEDPEFAFAWDNLGLNYRRLKNYDKAIEAYNKSLELDPNGIMPLQNIAVVYVYKKEYTKAVAAYEKLAKIDKNNPEIYYGVGNVYASYLNDYEKGLDNMCKAYNLYIEQKSPYRVDAEKMINFIHFKMKKQGKEKEFNKILKANKIKSK